MELNNLRYFVEVVQYGSFAAVARKHSLAASSISRAIASLEHELGIRLFQRSTRRLQATEAGIIYFERVEPIVEELQRAQSMASDTSEQARGLLRVTAPQSFAQLNLVPLLPEFFRKFPKVDIDLHMNNSITDLLVERIDVAIRLGPLDDVNYVARRLCAMNYRICASPEYISEFGKPSKPEQISQHNCLLFPMSRYRSVWKFKDRQGNVAEIETKGRCSISNGLSLSMCAVAGMGVVIQPYWNVQQELNDGRLIDLFPNYAVTATDFDIYAWVLYPSRSYLPLKTRAFVDFLITKFAQYTELKSVK